MRPFLLLLTICYSTPTSAQEARDRDEALLQKYRAAAVEKWEQEIVKLEARDQENPDPADAILFIGSSSIRRWDNIAVDVAPFRVIQRGYGGAKFSDLAVYAKRIIHPHQYRALVIFVANDVSGREDDRTPEEVEALARYVVGVSHAHQSGAPVLIIEITPTEKRFAVWDQIRVVNGRLREIALTTADTYFISTAGHYLRPAGAPRSELFDPDQLHLNADGYQLWGRLIRRRLEEVFRLMALTESNSIADEASQLPTEN